MYGSNSVDKAELEVRPGDIVVGSQKICSLKSEFVDNMMEMRTGVFLKETRNNGGHI